MIIVSLFKIFRNLFRLINKFLKKFGLLLSKSDYINGSPAFNGSLVLSRRMFQTKEFLNTISDVEGDIVEGGVHWGYGLVIELLLSQKKYMPLIASQDTLKHLLKISQVQIGSRWISHLL